MAYVPIAAGVEAMAVVRAYFIRALETMRAEIAKADFGSGIFRPHCDRGIRVPGRSTVSPESRPPSRALSLDPGKRSTAFPAPWSLR
jgi:hypothetical protein